MSLVFHDIKKISPRKGGLGPFGNMPTQGDSAAKIQKVFITQQLIEKKHLVLIAEKFHIIAEQVVFFAIFAG